MKKKRLLTVVAAALAVIMLFSVFYIALEADHDCQGEECAVCEQIRLCMDLLEHLTLALTVITVIVLLRLITTRCRTGRFYTCRQISLISLKVKLSD